MSGAPPVPPPLSTVHLLMVHGVGGHDHLSNLLRTYQSFRANLTSVEAPAEREDLIPGWRVTSFDEGANPPVLTLEPREKPMPGTVGRVCVYEVNYSGLAGVVRKNHPLNLTRLFLGLDLVVCQARQRRRRAATTSYGGDNAELARCLQRVTAVLTAGAVPIIGLPALAFKNFIGTFVALFTRFFDDVATFVLDKNGEQLIAAHLDRTMATIKGRCPAGDRMVLAAHSLGSVVAHNYVVRQWTVKDSLLPDTVITFGSPIGLLTWIWLFLDFEDMDIARRVEESSYFCWNPLSNGGAARPALSWINVVNAGDPIATAFPEEALDLSSPRDAIVGALHDRQIEHRFFGRQSVWTVGASHGDYLNDRRGFVEILLRAVALVAAPPQAVAGTPAAPHWLATTRVLRRAQVLLYLVAMAGLGGYLTILQRAFLDSRAYWLAALFAFPAVTIGAVAFFQRLMLGGPTKRTTAELIRGMPWLDLSSLPYRLRERVSRLLTGEADVDPLARGPNAVRRLGVSLVSFVPTLAMMAAPVFIMCWWTGRWPAWSTWWSHLTGRTALLGLAMFMIYATFCALFELVGAWRRVVRSIATAPAGQRQAVVTE